MQYWESQDICRRCQYLGDKYSFPLPNNLLEADAQNQKKFYCCCGDCTLYGLDVTEREIGVCKWFEEL